jgi:hypothetical protein
VQIEQEEIEILKRIRTTTQVHKNCKENNILIFILFIVCENLEQLNLNDVENMNFQNSNKEFPTKQGFYDKKIWK